MTRRSRRDMTRKQRLGFFLPHIAAALLIGAAIYLLLRPDVLFFRRLGERIPGGIPQELRALGQGAWWGTLLRCYAADFLWAYSLCMALLWIREACHRSLRLIVLISVCTDIGMEALQLLPFFHGVFDPLDILVQIGGTAAACCAVFLAHRVRSIAETERSAVSRP